MKFLIILLFGTLLLIAKGDESATTQQTTKPATSPTTTSIPTTKTTDPPKVDTKISSLCKKCRCGFRLKILDCSHLNLSEFLTKDDLHVLQYGNVQFEVIHLDENNIQSVPALPAIPSLKNLYLNNNKITSIEKAAFKELSNLEILDLSHNALTSKQLNPSIFEGKYSASAYEPLSNMKQLNLAYNQLHSLDPDLFEHFPNLENLSLAGNTFQIIDRVTDVALASLKYLKALDLSYMQLSDIPTHLLHSPRDLEKLNLTGNLLTKIPDALTYAVNLKSLFLDENIMKQFDGKEVFPRLTKLEVLSVSYMPDMVKFGKGAFSGLEYLKELMATNNPLLSYIHPNAFSRPHETAVDFDYPPLEKLYLHNNNLTTLDSSLLVRWDQVTVVDIRENPWKCDCDNTWLIHTLYPHILNRTPVLANGIKCDTPKEWHNFDMKEIHEKKRILRCPDSYDNHPEYDGPILIGILIGLVTGIPITFALMMIYKRGCFGLFGRQGPGDYSRAFYKRTSFREEF